MTDPDRRIETGGRAEEKRSCRRILVVSKHSATTYSGGRYHSWIMAEALAATNTEVVVWTDARPLVMRDFADYPNHGRVTLHIDPNFSKRPQGPFDIVTFVPHLSIDWGPNLAAVLAARSLNAPLIFLDFEAPNWFNAVSSQRRHIYRTAAFWATARYADVILSSTAYGSERARRYYRPLRPAEAFHHCYLGINSIAADSVETQRVNQIICITPFSKHSRYKGLANLFDLFGDYIAGYTLVVIGTMPEETAAQLREAAEAHGITFSTKSRLTDREKFEEIKKSRLMVFLSNFEGSGLPPVEAVYCGTPCIVNPLPVLQEVSGDALIYLGKPNTSLPQLAKETLDRDEPLVPAFQHDRVVQRVRFESYVTRIAELLIEVEKPGHKRAAARARSRADITAFIVVGTIFKNISRVFQEIQRRMQVPR